MTLFGALIPATFAVSVVFWLVIIVRRGAQPKYARSFLASALCLVLFTRMFLFNDSRGFAFFFFPALALMGTNAVLGLRDAYIHSHRRHV